MKRLMWVSGLSYLLIGLAHVVVGALLPRMLEHYGSDYKGGGLLIFLQFAGFLFGVLTTPWWTKMLGRRGALVMSTLSLFAAEALYTFLPQWNWMLIIAPFAGLGFGMVEAIIGALTIDAAENNKGVAMSRLEVYFGVGALVMPLIAGLLLLTDYWQASYVLVGLLSLALAICWGSMSFGKIDNMIRKQNGTGATHAGTNGGAVQARSPFAGEGIVIVAMFVTFFMLYVGVEMSFSNFLPSIQIEQFRLSESVSAFSVTTFWLAMAIGRFFAGNIAERYGYFRFLLCSGIGSVASLVLFSYSSAPWLSYVAVGAVGLFMSGIFSISLVFVNQLISGATERLTSIVVAAGGVGGALLPLGIGWCMDHFNVSFSMWVLVIGCVCLPLIIGWSGKYGKNAQLTALKPDPLKTK